MVRPLAHLDWNLLKTFRTVARTGSVSSAARALHREQPSVSAALKRIETHFGTALCVRTSRGIMLTRAGEAVFRACDEIGISIDRATEEVRSLGAESHATLHFRMISDVVSPSLDRALARFHRSHPRVDIRIDIAPWRAVLQAVRANEATLGIACDDAPADDLFYRPLLYEAQQLYCGPTHHLFGTAPMAPETLIAEAFVSTGADEPDDVRRFRAAHGLGRRSCGTAETLHEVGKLIKMGFGVGFLPTIVADSSDEALWPLLPNDILPRYPLYVVTNRAAPHTAQTEHLLASFLAGLGEPDYA